MVSMTLRGLDEATHYRLRLQAARHERSMEAEIRDILRRVLTPTPIGWFAAAQKAATGAAFLDQELDKLRDTDQPRAAAFTDEEAA